MRNAYNDNLKTSNKASETLIVTGEEITKPSDAFDAITDFPSTNADKKKSAQSTARSENVTNGPQQKLPAKKHILDENGSLIYSAPNVLVTAKRDQSLQGADDNEYTSLVTPILMAKESLVAGYIQITAKSLSHENVKILANRLLKKYYGKRDAFDQDCLRQCLTKAGCSDNSVDDSETPISLVVSMILFKGKEDEQIKYWALKIGNELDVLLVDAETGTLKDASEQSTDEDTESLETNSSKKVTFSVQIPCVQDRSQLQQKIQQQLSGGTASADTKNQAAHSRQLSVSSLYHALNSPDQTKESSICSIVGFSEYDAIALETLRAWIDYPDPNKRLHHFDYLFGLSEDKLEELARSLENERYASSSDGNSLQLQPVFDAATIQQALKIILLIKKLSSESMPPIKQYKLFPEIHQLCVELSELDDTDSNNDIVKLIFTNIDSLLTSPNDKQFKSYNAFTKNLVGCRNPRLRKAGGIMMILGTGVTALGPILKFALVVSWLSPPVMAAIGVGVALFCLGAALYLFARNYKCPSKTYKRIGQEIFKHHRTEVPEGTTIQRESSFFMTNSLNSVAS